MRLNQFKTCPKRGPKSSKNGKTSKIVQNSTTAKTQIVVFGPSCFKKSPFCVQISCTATKIRHFVFIFFFRDFWRFWTFLVPVQEICTQNWLFLKSFMSKTNIFWTKVTKKGGKSSIFGQKSTFFASFKSCRLNHVLTLRSLPYFQQVLKKKIVFSVFLCVYFLIYFENITNQVPIYIYITIFTKNPRDTKKTWFFNVCISDL